MRNVDVLVISPFRRPTFRTAISDMYPVEEPWDSPPLSVASELQASGLTVALLALQNIFRGFNPETDSDRLEDLIGLFRPRIVLFATDHLIASRSTATHYGIRVSSQLIRANSEGVLIGLCGRLATTAWRRVLTELPAIDFAVLGEAEAVLPDVVQQLLGGSAPHSLPSTVARCCLTDGCMQADFARIAEPDRLALPDYTLLTESVDIFRAAQPHRSTSVPFSLRTSYGCKFQCKFCAGVPNWRDYRLKSPDRVAAEIDSLRATFGNDAHLAFFEDEIFSRDENHVRGIADIMESRQLRVDGVYTHSTLVSDTTASELARMCKTVYFGLDNADDTILRAMGKGQKLGTIFDAIEVVRAAGLGVHLEWIIGTPPETVDSLITTLGAIYQLLTSNVVDSINTYVYCPHPGTEYAENATEYDLTIVDDFEFIQESGGYPASETGALTRNQVFIAYLISQLVIAEVRSGVRGGGANNAIRKPNRPELAALLMKVRSSSEAGSTGAKLS